MSLHGGSGPYQQRSSPPRKPLPQLPSQQQSGSPHKPLPQLPSQQQSGPPRKPLPQPGGSLASHAATPRATQQQSGPPRKPLPQPGGGVAAPATTPPAATPVTTTPQPPVSQPQGLTEVEKKLLKKRTGGSFQLLLDNVAGSTVSQRTYDPNNPEGKDGWEKFGKVWGIVDTAGQTLTGGTADFADGIQEARKIENFAELKGGNAKGLPIVGAIYNSIKTILDGVGYIKGVVDAVKEGRKRKLSAEEIGEQIKGGLDLLLGIAGTVNSYLSIWKKFSDAVPIIGAVIGCVSGIIGLVGDGIAMYKSSRNIHRMKAQKKAAKEAVKNKQGTQGFVTERSSKLDPKGLFGKSLHFDQRFFGDVTDAGTHKARKQRLDEKTAEMRTAGGDEALVSSLEDYDVTKELTGANEKRLRESVVGIVVNDLGGIATSLAGLDPSGIGGATATGINAALGLGQLAKTAIVATRTAGRNKGWTGFDINKSDQNKMARRHNLAVTTFDRLKSLSNFNLKTVPESTTNAEEIGKVKDGLPLYKTMEDRISSMGVGYGPLLRVGANGDEMVKLMRKGFYRDSK